MKKIALLAGCLLFLACSSDGDHAGTGQGGHGGGQAGTTGGGGHAGAAGGAGTNGTGGATGTAGNSGSGGQTGGSTGTAGSGGQAGNAAGGRGGVTGSAGNTGSGGQAGKAGQGGGSGGQAGGKAGQGGAGGKAGQGGTGGNGQSCTEIQTAYTKAIVDARMCNAALSVVQCTHMVQSSLTCGCPTWVNDTTELDKIKAQWDAAGCTPGIICPLIACVNPGTKAVCVPANSGDLCMGTN